LVVTTHGTYDDPGGAGSASQTARTRHYTPTDRQARSAFVSSTLADMDVAPLIGPTDDATYCIADRLQRQWLRTNPLEHTAKPFKWWRRENRTVGNDRRASSSRSWRLTA
ncbi:MAG: hypothetical protein OXF98_14105, partial [Rhodospirillaceae bacterium]|nr:hypothetical protein [Rhodospirillaceae bacterium]